MKICIVGANGRMGQAIIQIAQMQNIIIHSAVIRENTQYHGVALTQNNTKISNHIEKGADVILDFSNHQSTLNNIKSAVQYNIPILIGTTGSHTASDYKAYQNIIPILWAPNTSISWSIIQSSIEKINKIRNLAVSIGEVHHKNKADNPSGTTKQLHDKIQADQIWSLRAGDNMSMHQFLGLNNQEMIRFEHQVFNRKIYANDALKVCEWLVNQNPGLFTMQAFINNLSEITSLN
ncbi:4-hydroxy-tetrahydrodipicolinate reductase [Candidatus Cytomitobacter primus]|nr:dihydrodipicolinate reductase C-terminal domain-containing protein [Candidatus Cytomitobacter primus]